MAITVHNPNQQQLTQPDFRDLQKPMSGGGAGKAANGERVQIQSNVSSPLAQAMDMAEEVTFVRNEFKNDLDKRKLKKGDNLSQEILKRVQKVKSLDNTQEVKDFLNKLKANPKLTPDDIKEKLEETFQSAVGGKLKRDVLHEFMGLDCAIRHYEEANDEENVKVLKQFRNRFFMDNKQPIQAGLNVSDVAYEESQEHDFVTSLGARDTHNQLIKNQDHVSDHGSLEVAYDCLIEVYGDDKFEKAVDIQKKLLAADLNAVNQSTSSSRLKAIIDDLATLKVLAGLHDGCVETEEQIGRMYPELTIKKRALMKEMLHVIQQQWVTEADFGKMMRQINV